MAFASPPKQKSSLSPSVSGVLDANENSKFQTPPSRRFSRSPNLTNPNKSRINSAVTDNATFEADKRSSDKSSSFVPEKKKSIIDIDITTDEQKSTTRRKSSANSSTPCSPTATYGQEFVSRRKLIISSPLSLSQFSSRRKLNTSSLLPSSITPTSDRGNEEAVKVGVRIKPLLENDNEPRAFVLGPAENTIAKNMDNSESNTYQYNHVHGETSSTQQLYDDMASDIVESVGQGYNGTIFTYGHTSTGKTYTMHGVLMAAGKDLFGMTNDGTEFNEYGQCASTSLTSIRISCMELHNEELRDLLCPSTASLSIQEDRRGNVQISNLSERTTNNIQELMAVIQIAEENRTVGSTAINEQLSRCHTIFRITNVKKEVSNARVLFDKLVVGESKGDENDTIRGSSRRTSQKVITTVSTLNLVDLAGSENVRVSGAKGERQKEGGKINQSLLTLSRVLAKLGKKDRGHINYRDSKLTRILKPSLSGNARMGFICCISPAMQFSEETKSTLDFASRTMLVTTNAKSNQIVEYDDALVEEFEREIERVKMEAAKAEESRLKMQQSLQDAEEEIVRLRATIQLEKSKVSILERGNSDHSKQVEELRSCNIKNKENLLKEIDELKTRNQELEINVSQLESEKIRLEAQRGHDRDVFDRERKRLEEQHAMLTENHATELQNLENEAKGYKASKEETEAMYKEMKAELESNREDLQELRTSAEGSLKEIGELKAHNQELEVNLSQLESEKIRLEAQRGQDRDEFDQERKRLEEQHAMLTENHATELQNLKNEAKGYKASKEETEALYKKMKAELDSYSKDLQELRTSAEGSLKEIGELKARNQELEVIVALLESEKIRLEAQRGQDRDEFDRKRKRLEEEHAMLTENHATELQNLKNEVKEYSESNEDIHCECEKKLLEVQREHDRDLFYLQALLTENHVLESQKLKNQAKEYEENKQYMEALYKKMKAELDCKSEELQELRMRKTERNGHLLVRVAELEHANAALAGQLVGNQGSPDSTATIDEIATLKFGIAALSQEKSYVEHKLEKVTRKAKKRKGEAKQKRQKVRRKLAGMTEILKEHLVHTSYQEEC